jgi:glyoxylase-like metal-dependent hydrolase (beta-lactamase superfamily II)
MKLHAIETGNFKLDGGAMFGVVPKSIWNKLNPADENNMCTWAMRCMLIEDEGKLILIDTGIGNKQSDKFYSHYYLHGDTSLEKSLSTIGFNKNDITDVWLTHLHFDHCGGAIERIGENLIPAFKNANFWSHTSHWQWAINPNAREKASFLKENILPIEATGQLKFINENDMPFGNNINVKLMKGHTESMMLPTINYNGRTVVFMADLLPAAAHVPLPYIMAYDMFPMQTLTEKTAFLQEAVANNYVLFFEHDPINECCTLMQTDKGIVVDDCFRLCEL